VPTGYFRVKAEQERVVSAGPVPWSLVRATQFHELVAGTVADAREMARIWRSATGRRALLLPVPLPGQLGRALRRGVLSASGRT
jgi:uncharacterized protein YbjT (DUF2867 family)